MRDIRSTLISIGIGMVTLLAIIHPFLYWNFFGGDGEIHFVYASNFLAGYPLQFNKGLPDSGETSMGYMLLLAGIMRLVGDSLAPICVKLLSVVAIYAIAIQTLILAKRLDVPSRWSVVAALATLLLPGSVFNGMLGTENSLFAALVLSWVLLADHFNWFSSDELTALRSEINLGALLGALFWIRPEAAPIGLAAFCARCWGIASSERRFTKRFSLGLGIFSATAVAVAVAYIALFYFWAGVLPFGAGMVRRLFSIAHDSRNIFGVPINVKVVERLFSYISIVFPASLSLVSLANKGIRGERDGLQLFLGLCFFGVMGLHIINLLPGFHFARYTIYVWPFGILLAVQYLSNLHLTSKYWLARSAIAVCCGAFLAVGAYETYLRQGMLVGSSKDLQSLAAQPAQRTQYSNDLLKELEYPKMRPIVVGYTEVQVRYALDDRFVVRALDGVTDPELKKYLCNGYIDHDGYLLDRHVDFLMSLPNYNTDAAHWSLSDLNKLRTGQKLERPGIRYTKLASGDVRVERLLKKSSDRLGGQCSK